MYTNLLNQRFLTDSVKTRIFKDEGFHLQSHAEQCVVFFPPSVYQRVFNSL